MSTKGDTDMASNTSTKRPKGREVYASGDYVNNLLSAYNAIEDQILALRREMGDKAPQCLEHCANGVRARHDYAHATYATHDAEFGSPFTDYTVIPRPALGVWRRWRLRLLYQLAIHDTWRVKGS